MSKREMGLTGLALAALAFWESSIAAIPLGIYTLHYSEQPQLFLALILLQQLLAAFWLSRALLRRSQPRRSAATSELAV